jgi:hypothetical protein
MADAFMTAKKGVLVIYDTKDLKGWWDSLPITWQRVFSEAAKTGSSPSHEELAKITNLDSINISGNNSVKDIEPLERLQEIHALIAPGTGINNLLPLQAHRGIRTLDISGTEVQDISILQHFSNLSELRADQSKIQNLDPLLGLRALKKIYADGTLIQDAHVQEFLSKNSECLVVFKTDTLVTWWNELSEDWKEVFKAQVAINPKTRKEDLHRLVELESLQFKDAPVNDLAALGVFVRLQDLNFSGTALSDIAPLSNIKSIKKLYATNSPIRDLSPLGLLENLEDLDISNTPVEELNPLSDLQNLKVLNCSGTQVSNLSPLENLSLESLDCSNTNVKRLSPLFGLPLKTLKCYNTRVSSKEVDKFKNRVPDCNVIYYR